MTMPEISRNGYEHIEFKRIDDGTMKTSVWSCCNKKSGDGLGFVKWYGAWRQYCFCVGGPQSNTTVLSRSCMDDIQDFINNLMKAREAQRQGKTTAWLGDPYLGAVDQKPGENVKND
jgi:hypothetical protein